MDLTLAELQEMASRQQQQIEAQQQMLATKVMCCFKRPDLPLLLYMCKAVHILPSLLSQVPHR